MNSEVQDCRGYCRRCGREHVLSSRRARYHAGELLERLDEYGRLDFSDRTNVAGVVDSTAPLFGLGRGKMFGVLLCRNAQGQDVVLKAFSGQFNGRWVVPGWVGPLFAEKKFHACNDQREKKIKDLGRTMETLPEHCRQRVQLAHQRKRLSRQLMEDIFSLYRLPNFKGEELPLQEVFVSDFGMPTGTGDCCAPKLLGHAARNQLVPLSLVEFFYGRENVSGSCRHKQFYPPCSHRCVPILGHMLCGLDEL